MPIDPQEVPGDHGTNFEDDDDGVRGFEDEHIDDPNEYSGVDDDVEPEVEGDRAEDDSMSDLFLADGSNDYGDHDHDHDRIHNNNIHDDNINNDHVQDDDVHDDQHEGQELHEPQTRKLIVYFSFIIFFYKFHFT